MTVSSEVRTRRMVLPEVTGLHVDDARVILGSAGFSNITVHYTESYADDFAVVEQDPKSGLLLDSVREIRLQVSRNSLLGFLPGIYQQQAGEGASFLHGYLYIVQQLADGVSGRLEHIHELFDPRTADAEFLPWLASWLAITLNPDWNEKERRKMLLAATKLFPYRGTARAIREFVRIYAGTDVEIDENTWPFSGFRIEVSSTIGEDSVILPPMNLAHCFVVKLDKPASDFDDHGIIKIHQIIRTQKPAHTTYFLAFNDGDAVGPMGAFLEIGDGAIGIEDIGIGTSEMLEEASPSEPATETEQAIIAAERDKESPSKTARAKGGKAASRGRSRAAVSEKSIEPPPEDTAEPDGKAVEGSQALEETDKKDARAERKKTRRKKSDEPKETKVKGKGKDKAPVETKEEGASEESTADDDKARARAERRKARQEKAAELKAAKARIKDQASAETVEEPVAAEAVEEPDEKAIARAKRRAERKKRAAELEAAKGALKKRASTGSEAEKEKKATRSKASPEKASATGKSKSRASSAAKKEAAPKAKAPSKAKASAKAKKPTKAKATTKAKAKAKAKASKTSDKSKKPSKGKAKK